MFEHQHSDHPYYEQVDTSVLWQLFLCHRVAFYSLITSAYLHHEDIGRSIMSWPEACQLHFLKALLSQEASVESGTPEEYEAVNRHPAISHVGHFMLKAYGFEDTYEDEVKTIIPLFTCLNTTEQLRLLRALCRTEHSDGSRKLIIRNLGVTSSGMRQLAALYAAADTRQRSALVRDFAGAAVPLEPIYRLSGTTPEVELASQLRAHRMRIYGSAYEDTDWDSFEEYELDKKYALADSPLYNGMIGHWKKVKGAFKTENWQAGIMHYARFRQAFEMIVCGLSDEQKLKRIHELESLQSALWSSDYTVAMIIVREGVTLTGSCVAPITGRLNSVGNFPFWWEKSDAQQQLDELRAARPYDVQFVTTHLFNDAKLPKSAAIITAGEGGMDHATARGEAWGIPVAHYPFLPNILRFLQGRWVELTPTENGQVHLRVLKDDEVNMARAQYGLSALRQSQTGLKSQVAEFVCLRPDMGWQSPRGASAPSNELMRNIFSRPEVLAMFRYGNRALFSGDEIDLLSSFRASMLDGWRDQLEHPEHDVQPTDGANLSTPKAYILRSDHPQEDHPSKLSPGVFESVVSSAGYALPMAKAFEATLTPQVRAYYEALQMDPFEAGLSLLLQEVIDGDYSGLARCDGKMIEVALAPGLCVGLTGDGIDKIERPMKLRYKLSDPLDAAHVEIVSSGGYSQKITHYFRLSDQGEVEKVSVSGDADMRQPVVTMEQAVDLVGRIVRLQTELQTQPELAWAKTGLEFTHKDGQYYLLQARPL